MTGAVYLAFDYGTRRIGVAVGDPITRTARPMGVVANDWTQIERLLNEWRPAACIVGLPLDEENNEQAISREARRFAGELERHFRGPVHLCDERYSTRSAMQDLRSARADGSMKRRIRKGDTDSAAARVILEQWLAEANGR